MAYFCFIESEGRSIPHMEALDADDPSTALQEAKRLMAQHARVVAAHVFEGDRRLLSIEGGDVTA